MKRISYAFLLILGTLALRADASDVATWDPVATNNSNAPPNGFPENMAYSGMNDAAREVMAAVARLHRDTNGSLASAGAANVYTLTPNGTYAAYAAGQQFAFRVHAANTGASTLNVSGLGAQAIVSGGGSALIAGQLALNKVALVVYDGTNFQLLGVEEPNQSLTSITLNSTTDVALASTAHALQIGAATAPNLAASEGIVQARNNGAAADLELNPLGGNVLVGEDAANASVVQLRNLVTQVRGGANTVLILINRADGAPAINAAQTVLQQFNSSSGVSVGKMGFQGSVDLQVTNEVTSGDLLLQATDATTGVQTILDGDPDEGTKLFRHLVEFNAQNGNYELGLTDGGKVVLSDGSVANQITVPANATTAFPIGTQIRIVNDGSVGVLSTTVVQAGGVTVYGSGLVVSNKRGALLLKTNTNEWLISHG